MIIINNEKFTIDNVDVYPDHEKKNQYWLVPGTIALAEKADKTKKISYFWYSTGAGDADGTGFLNFEVNSRVSEATERKIKDRLNITKNLVPADISLAPVPYTNGSVSFSVLYKAGARAEVDPRDKSVIYSSAEQVSWNAGSPSLIGDNAAVCSVRFTKEGKLAAAMANAIEGRPQDKDAINAIAAVYNLEFLALRPALQFEAHGEFSKVIETIAASIGVEIPLEVFILDLGLEGRWTKILTESKIDIKVIDYVSGEANEGRKFAEKILQDYLIKNLFNVEIDGKVEKDTPLVKDNPPVAKAIEKGAALADTAKTDDKTKDKPVAEKEKAAKEAVAAALPASVPSLPVPLPKLKLRLSYEKKTQNNKIDFYFNETRAKAYPVAPQALVLEGLGKSREDREQYVVRFDRAANPYLQPFPVDVALPSDLKALGLRKITVRAKYPASAPSEGQQNHQLTMSDDGTVAGDVTPAIPFPFKYGDKGPSDVNYAINYLFDPSQDWNADRSEYSCSDTILSGAINAQVLDQLDFRTLQFQPAEEFCWEDDSQIVVTLTSKRWTGEKRVVIQKGKTGPAMFRIRSAAEFRGEKILYRVSVRKNNKETYHYGPEEAPLERNSVVEIHDKFAGHIPVKFSANFTTAKSAQIVMTYEDWEGDVDLTADQEITTYIPTAKEVEKPNLIKIDCEVIPDKGDSFTLKARAGKIRNVIKA
jgi:hypothetical protein